VLESVLEFKIHRGGECRYRDSVEITILVPTNMSRNNAVRSSDILVHESTQLCLVRLAELSRKLRKNTEGLGVENIVNFKDEIAALSSELVTSKFLHRHVGDFVVEELGKRGTDDTVGPEDFKKNIRKRVADAKEAFEATKDTDYLGVVSILMDCGKKDDMDADMVLIDTGLTDRTILDSYSMTVFDKPMKKYVPVFFMW
jgi:hypothetical protein